MKHSFDEALFSIQNWKPSEEERAQFKAYVEARAIPHLAQGAGGEEEVPPGGGAHWAQEGPEYQGLGGESAFETLIEPGDDSALGLEGAVLEDESETEFSRGLERLLAWSSADKLFHRLMQPNLIEPKLLAHYARPLRVIAPCASGRRHVGRGVALRIVSHLANRALALRTGSAC